MSQTPAVTRGTLSRSNPRRRRQLSTAFGAIASLGVVLPLLDAASPAWLYPSLFALLGAVVFFTTAERDPGPSRGVEGHLRIGDDAVVAESEDPGHFALSLPRADIVDGWIEPHTTDEGHTSVLVARDGTQLRLSRDDRMSDGPAAAPLEGVLAALGLDERAVLISLVAAHRGVRGGMGILMGLMLVSAALTALYTVIALLSGDGLALSGGLLLMTVFIAPVLAMPHFLIAHRLLVGRDGVLVKQLFRLQEYIAYDRLRAASGGETHVELATTDGGHVPVRASGPAVEIAVQIIEDRLHRYRSDDRDRVVAALERGSQSADQWRATLSGLLDPARASFRRAVIRAEDLVTIVSDPKATPTQRVSAAFALVAHGSHEDNRLRIAVEGCAHPKLRIALERAAAGELDEVALARAEQSMAEARAR